MGSFRLGIFLFIISFALPSSAQVKVIRAKGRQAVVEFPPGSEPEAGEVFYFRSAPEKTRSKGARRQSVGGTADFSYMSDSKIGTVASYAAAVRYGWNMGMMEVGPIGEFTYTASEVLNLKQFLGGGFVDFNFIENTSSEITVYGISAEGVVGQTAKTTLSVENATLTYGLYGSGFWKWFPFGNSVALRGDVGFSFKTSAETTGDSTQSGLMFRGGLQVYF